MLVRFPRFRWLPVGKTGAAADGNSGPQVAGIRAGTRLKRPGSPPIPSIHPFDEIPGKHSNLAPMEREPRKCPVCVSAQSQSARLIQTFTSKLRQPQPLNFEAVEPRPATRTGEHHLSESSGIFIRLTTHQPRVNRCNDCGEGGVGPEMVPRELEPDFKGGEFFGQFGWLAIDPGDILLEVSLEFDNQSVNGRRGPTGQNFDRAITQVSDVTDERKTTRNVAGVLAKTDTLNTSPKQDALTDGTCRRRGRGHGWQTTAGTNQSNNENATLPTLAHQSGLATTSSRGEIHHPANRAHFSRPGFTFHQ